MVKALLISGNASTHTHTHTQSYYEENLLQEVKWKGKVTEITVHCFS